MSNNDKLIRVLIGFMIGLLYYFNIIKGYFGIILMFIAIVILLTSLLRICPIYYLIGKCTYKARTNN